MKRRLLIIVLTFAVGVGTVWAQDDGEQDRGVARLSVLNGDVSIKRGDSGDWIAAAVNGPLVVGDSVYAGADSRAEVQFDWADFARLGENTEVRLTELENNRFMMQVSRGTLLFSIIRDPHAQVEISLPSVAVRPTEMGLYRVDVFEDGTAQVTVRSGRADVFNPNGSQSLGPGRTMYVRGSIDDPEFRVAEAIGSDSLEQWALNRDGELRDTRAYQYVNDSVYGASDLDQYGDWIDVEPYGYVWSPRVVVDWAPYRYGRWTWLDWYGWTWVSYDPWGWAPYHYGRWFYSANRWCWWPGGIGMRHAWRPALVGWVGFGGDNWSVGFGFGNLGWIPLAPYETYHPWYGRRFYGGYAGRFHNGDRINIVNNINIGNTYRNARVRNGISGIDVSDFRAGRFSRVRGVQEGQLRQASVMRGTLPVAPDRANLRLTDRQVQRGALPRDQGGNRFFATRQAPKVERVSFEQQRTAIQGWSQRAAAAERRQAPGAGQTGAVRGQPERAGVVNADRARTAGSAPRESGRSGVTNVDRGGWRTIGEAPAGRGATTRVQSEATSGATSEAAPGRTAGTGATRGGWRNIGEPANSPSSGASGRSADSTWTRFGDPRGSARTSSRSGEVRRNDFTQPTTRSNSSTNTRQSGQTGWTSFGDPSRGASRSGRGGASVQRQQDSGGRNSLPARAPVTIDRGNRGGGSSNSGGRAAPAPRQAAPARSGSSGRGRQRSSLSPSQGWSSFENSPRTGTTYNSSARASAGGSSARQAFSGGSSSSFSNRSAPAQSGRSWSTFSGRSSASATPRSYSTPSRQPSAYPSFGSRGSYGSSTRSAPSYSAPSRPARSFEGFGAGRSYGSSTRSAPSYSAPSRSFGSSGSRGSFGGAVRSAPSYRAPSFSTPSRSFSRGSSGFSRSSGASRPSFGGGGSFGRSSGGGRSGGHRR